MKMQVKEHVDNIIQFAARAYKLFSLDYNLALSRCEGQVVFIYRMTKGGLVPNTHYGRVE